MPDTDCPDYEKERCPENCTPESCPILREGKATPKKFLQKADLFHWLADHFVKNDKSHIIYGIFADILRFFEANEDKLNYSGLVGLQEDINKHLKTNKNVLELKISELINLGALIELKDYFYEIETPEHDLITDFIDKIMKVINDSWQKIRDSLPDYLKEVI